MRAILQRVDVAVTMRGEEGSTTPTSHFPTKITLSTRKLKLRPWFRTRTARKILVAHSDCK